jgi:hypothetical protein
MAQHMLSVRPRSRVGVGAQLAGMLVLAIVIAIGTLGVTLASAWILVGLAHS